MLPEGVDQSTVDVVDGDAEGYDDHIIDHSCEEVVPLIHRYSRSAVWKIHVWNGKKSFPPEINTDYFLDYRGASKEFIGL